MPSLEPTAENISKLEGALEQERVEKKKYIDKCVCMPFIETRLSG